MENLEITNRKTTSSINRNRVVIFWRLRYLKIALAFSALTSNAFIFAKNTYFVRFRFDGLGGGGFHSKEKRIRWIKRLARVMCWNRKRRVMFRVNMMKMYGGFSLFFLVLALELCAVRSGIYRPRRIIRFFCCIIIIILSQDFVYCAKIKIYRIN